MCITNFLYKLSHKHFSGHSEYSKFATNLAKQNLSDLTTREQYQKIYEFLKQEESKNKEHTYDFSKRFIENAKSREKQSDIHISTLYGFIIGLLSTALCSLPFFQTWNDSFKSNNFLFFLPYLAIIFIFFIIFALTIFFDAQRILFTNKMTNLPIILTVLEDYCEEVEATFKQRRKISYGHLKIRFF